MQVWLEGDAGEVRVLGPHSRHNRVLPAYARAQNSNTAAADTTTFHLPILDREERKYLTVMLSRKVWRYLWPVLESAVSIVNLVHHVRAVTIFRSRSLPLQCQCPGPESAHLVEKMLASLAP